MGKLSDRAEILLGIVRECCTFSESGALKRYFVPREDRIYSVYGVDIPNPPLISGSGDAAIFRSLEKRGLIKSQSLTPYAYAITEDGILKYEEIAGRKRASRG